MKFSRPESGVGSLFFLQGIFPTQGSNPGVPHCKKILYQLSHKGSPKILGWVDYPFSRGIFPTQELNWGLLHYTQILYQVSYQESPNHLSVPGEGYTPAVKGRWHDAVAGGEVCSPLCQVGRGWGGQLGGICWFGKHYTDPMVAKVLTPVSSLSYVSSSTKLPISRDPHVSLLHTWMMVPGSYWHQSIFPTTFQCTQINHHRTWL